VPGAGRLAAHGHATGPAARRPVYQQPDPTWIDPETGLRCQNTGIATVCSN